MSRSNALQVCSLYIVVYDTLTLRKSSVRDNRSYSVFEDIRLIEVFGMMP